MSFIEEIDDSLRVAAPWYPTQFSPPPSKTSLGISPISSLAPSSQNEPVTPPQKPQLEPPQETYQLGLIRRSMRFEQLTEKEAKIYEENSEQIFSKLDKLKLEKQEIIRKKTAAMQACDTLSVWKKVAQYGSSAAYIALGMAASSSVPGSGTLLIASGIVGLANLILQDTGALYKIVSQFTESEEAQQKWSQRIETGLFVTSLALGFAGGIKALKEGALAAARNAGAEGIKKTIEEIIAISSTALGITTQFGEAYEKKKLASLQKQMLNISSEIQLLEWNLYSDSKRADEIIHLTSDAISTTKDVISGAAVSLDL